VARSSVVRARIVIEREWCKGCGICVAFCPAGVLSMDDQEKAVVTALEKCTVCRDCELRCPDLAIEVSAEPASGER
jgi:2-oxoglutarate ferredoxin oxidoreductase subunit delta